MQDGVQPLLKKMKKIKAFVRSHSNYCYENGKTTTGPLWTPSTL